MKHYSRFIQPGAVLLEVSGHWSSMASAFKNPDGEIVVVVRNALNCDHAFTFDGEGKSFSVLLEKNSFNTFVL